MSLNFPSKYETRSRIMCRNVNSWHESWKQYEKKLTGNQKGCWGGSPVGGRFGFSRRKQLTTADQRPYTAAAAVVRQWGDGDVVRSERPWVGLESFEVLPPALVPLHFQKKSQNRSVCRLSFSSCLVEKMFFTMFCILSGFNNNLFPDSFLSPNFAGWPKLQWPHLVDNNNENHLY